MRRSDGTIPGLRRQLPWPESKPFRILSIDGGGILGILPAQILAEFEVRYLAGQCIGNQFDLIAGTSTGGIMALALAMGISAQTILALYMQHGGEVFPPPGRHLRGVRNFGRFLWGMTHYRYDPEPLERHLRTTFGHTILGQAQRRLCVPSFDGFTEVHIYKTPHHPDFKEDWRDELVTAALATAAAPTYFPVYRNRGRHFADGGVWANDPCMIALVDALSCYALDRRQVHILSLGCGDDEMTMTKRQIARGGLWHWRAIIKSAMHLQSKNAQGQAGLLIGRDQLIRLNAPAAAGPAIEMDDYERARDELPAIALGIAARSADAVRERFLIGETEPFAAYHGPRMVKPDGPGPSR